MSIQIKDSVILFVIFIVSLNILSILFFAIPSIATAPNSGNSPPEKTDLQENSNSHSCYCVAFRLDDIIDYSVTDPLIEVMNVFKEKTLI